jgi:Cu+-exporting ATPase
MHMQHKVDPEDALRLPSFRSLYVLTGVLGVLIGGHLVLAALGYTGSRKPFGFADLALLAAVIGGARIVYGALVALFEGNVGADLALAIAVLASLMLKEYWVGAEVVFIAMVGESLEAITFSRTHREIRRILELQPRTAHLLRGDAEVDVPVTEVAVGDRVVVRPGERVPVDGTVLKGQSAVDQSTLTGESLPVDKSPGDAALAGTLNQFGALELRADKLGEDTTLGQVIQLVSEAQANKAPLERTADRLARVFLPAVLVCAVATLIFSNWGTTSLGRLNWMPTLAVLVVACPCALILATPAAIMAAWAWLAKRGVLIKGGIALERLARINALAFDKTGTLTEGKLQLGDVIPLGGRSTDEVLALAAAAEQRSEHLIARLIVNEAQRRGLPLTAVDEFTALPGAGVVAHLPETGASPASETTHHSLPARRDLADSTLTTHQICVGNRRLLEQQGIGISAEISDAFAQLDASGQTSLAVAIDGRVIGLIGARDTIRSEAAEVLHELRHLGINEIVLLTGDRRPAAAVVAHAAGIDHVEAEMLPQEKAAWIRRWHQRGSSPPTTHHSPLTTHQPAIGMVGDGVNDAPALASADVGLALGGVGSDIAAEAGDLILMGAPLTPLPDLVRLSRAVVRVIRQNIVLFAFVVNFIGIVLTAWIMPTWSAAWEKRAPVAAALFHQVGSFLVLVNAMRLLWFERWERSPLGRFEAIGSAWVQSIEELLQPALRPLVWLAGHRRTVAWLGAAAGLVAYAVAGITTVRTDEVGVVRRCGRFAAKLDPGLYFRLPPPWEQVTKFSPERVRVVEVGFRTKPDAPRESTRPVEWTSTHLQGMIERVEDESFTFTGDENLLDLSATVQFSVRPAELTDYLFRVRDADEIVKALAEGVLREMAARRSFWDILTAARGELETQSRELLQQRLDDYALGVEIHAVAVQDVHPPLQVVSAFHDVSSAFKDQERMQKEAIAYYQQQILTAAGDAVLEKLSQSDGGVNDAVWKDQLRDHLSGEAAGELLKAEAQRTERRNKATGEAASFRKRQAAHARAPELSELRLYLDTIQATLADEDKLILDPAAAGRRQLFLANPENFIKPGAMPLLSRPEQPRRGEEEEP